MSATFIPEGDQWKDPRFVAKWERGKQQRKKIEADWERRLKFEPFLATPQQAARGAVQDEFEKLTTRARRLESLIRGEDGKYYQEKRKAKSPDQARHQVPAMIAKDGGGWILHPGLDRAGDLKLRKTEKMYDNGLIKKAQREIACGLLAGEQSCESGHKFQTAYRCGNRYCPTCAPIDGRKLFARQHDRIFGAVFRIMRCPFDCAECDRAAEKKEVPHWPPTFPGKPRRVLATIDFTARHERGGEMPTPKQVQAFNDCIKTWRDLVCKAFGLELNDIGLAFCDEFGADNSNLHAHAIYAGPWLPQKVIAELWREATHGRSFVIYIKQAESFGRALFHALKYPQKYAAKASGERLADLETVFHMTRRFHTLGAFYNPKDLPPPKPKPEPKRCPLCDSRLSVPRGWKFIADLSAAGLCDVEWVRREIERERGLSGDSSPP